MKQVAVLNAPYKFSKSNKHVAWELKIWYMIEHFVKYHPDRQAQYRRVLYWGGCLINPGTCSVSIPNWIVSSDIKVSLVRGSNTA